MNDLHSNWSWFVALISVLSIAIGFGYLVRTLFPRIFASSEVLEHKVQERTAEIMTINAQLRQEIAVREHTEKTLKKNDELLRRYFNAGIIGMVIATPDKRWIQVNDAFCNMLGYSREELLSMSWDDVSLPDDIEEIHAKLNQVLAGKLDSGSLDKRYIRKDGKIVHAILSAECVRKDDGSLDYFVAFIQDITDRKQAEIALKKSEEQYRTIIEITREWVWEIDKERVITFSNPLIEDILGYRVEELLNRNACDFMLAEDKDIFLCAYD